MCGLMISKRRYKEHTSRCLVSGFDLVRNPERKEFIYHCQQCPWKGRKERAIKHQKAAHKPLPMMPGSH